MQGNWGRILDIDLTSSEITDRRIDNTIQRLYVGGSALGTRLLHDAVDPATPALSPGNVLYFATGTCGASHRKGFPHLGEQSMLLPEVGYTDMTDRDSMEGKAFLTKLFQDYAVVVDSLAICAFMQNNGLTLPQTVEVLNAITGADYDPVSLIKVGERATNLQRVFNNRAGFTRAHDRLPVRMFEPAEQGPGKGRVPDPFDEALSEYYRLRGWSQDGVPADETLAELELSLSV